MHRCPRIPSILALLFLAAGVARAQCVAPSLAQPLADALAAYNEPATFSVQVHGTGPFTYAWYEATTPSTLVSRETTWVTPQVTFGGGGSYKGGTYFVWVSGACGSVVSNVAKVVLDSGIPSISVQPSGPARCWQPPPTHTMFVEATGIGPFTYDWYRYPPGQIVGTGQTYEITSNDPATYFARANNRFASTATRVVSIEAPQTPATLRGEEPFASPRSIKAGDTSPIRLSVGLKDIATVRWFAMDDPATTLGTTNICIVPAPAKFTRYAVTATEQCGIKSATFTNFWAEVYVCDRAPTITTEPQDRDNTLGTGLFLSVGWSSQTPYGTSTHWYESTPNGSVRLPSAFVNPTKNTVYFAWVMNPCAGVITRAVTVRVCNAPPVITGEPADATIAAGQSATLATTATGLPTLIQWYRADPAGSVPIGQGASIHVTPAESATYFAWLYNDCGAAITRAARVNVQ